MEQYDLSYDVPLDLEQFERAFCGRLFHPYVTELYYKVVDYAMHIHYGGLSFNAESYPVEDYDRALSLAILLRKVALYGIKENGFEITDQHYLQPIAEGIQQALKESIYHIQALTETFLFTTKARINGTVIEGGLLSGIKPKAWVADSHNEDRIKYEDRLGELFVRHTYDIPLSLPSYHDVGNLVYPYDESALDDLVAKIKAARDESVSVNSITEDFPMSYFLCSVFTLPVKQCNQAYQEIYDALMLMELIPEELAKSHSTNCSPYAARNYIKSKVLRLVEHGYIDKQ